MIDFQLDYAYKHYQQITKLEDEVFHSNLKPIYKSDKEIKALMLFDDNQLIAFLTCKRHDFNVEIYNLAVTKKYRMQGLGKRLIDKLANFDCSLEVRSSNLKAIEFYQRNNFVKSHIRKNYYKDEDAIVFIRNRYIEEKAYAKINLVLNVLAKREDGFHEIEFLMNSVNLFDTVLVEKSNQDQVIVVDRDDLSNLDNLAFKALQLLRDEYKFSNKYKITIDKKIPVAAGMAGGSSDAAAVMRAINILEGLQISNEQLSLLGSKVGSDVSYCVYSKLAIAKGRGEQVELVTKKLPKTHILVINPGVELSTPTVYKNHTISNEHGNIKKMLTTNDFDGMCNYLSNDLEVTAKKICPQITELETQLREHTNEKIIVSGSGPTLLVFSEDEAHIEHLKDIFSAKYKYVYSCVMD